MKDFGKWIYRMIVLLLLILMIDFNCSWLESASGTSRHIAAGNLILGGLIVILLIFPKIKRRR